MQKRSRKPSVLDSPPVQFEFDLNAAFNTKSSSSKKKIKSVVIDRSGASASMLMQPTGSPPHPPPPSSSVKSVSSVLDLKSLAASKLDSIKGNLDRAHSEILNDAEASRSRLHKRFKIQAQACQQVVDEAERECKKMTERINESREAMKASYAEFIAEAQASASRVCKTSFSELSQSFKKSIDAIRSRYGIPSTSA